MSWVYRQFDFVSGWGFRYTVGATIFIRNGKIVWKHGRLKRNLFDILKLTEQPQNTRDQF